MIDLQSIRIDGIYRQRQDDYFMQRVKLAAGVISTAQARSVALTAQRFGQGKIHLTSRGSMEIHWLRADDLPRVKRELAKVGLTSRGACGGAVRGISCASQGAQEFPRLAALAQRLHRHFTANPRFEGLPKKFKIGIEADTAGGRHLIQDVGLVLAKEEAGRGWYDIWIAGGLGREPQPGFRLLGEVAEERLIPIIEAVVRVYTTHAPPPKRLKFLAKSLGEAKLRQLIEAEPTFHEELPPTSGLPEQLVAMANEQQRLAVPVFAGELTSDELSNWAEFAEAYADGVLLVTTNQDLAFQLATGIDPATATARFHELVGPPAIADTVAFRVCPGSHECLMGLAATRDVASKAVQAVPLGGRNLQLAISGCPNSCTQPQLADVGIVASRLVADADAGKTPRFDLYRRNDSGLGQRVAEAMDQAELLAMLAAIG